MGLDKKFRGKNFSIRIEGFDQVMRGLALTKNQKANLQKFLDKEADKVIRTAKEEVPVKTGRLRDSHRKLTGGATQRGFVKVDIVAGGIIVRSKMVNYAQAVHDNNPWLARAVARHAAGYEHRLAKAIKIRKG